MSYGDSLRRRLGGGGDERPVLADGKLALIELFCHHVVECQQQQLTMLLLRQFQFRESAAARPTD